MDQSIDKLYSQFLAAAAFFNEQVERKYSSDRERALFRIKILSAEEFSRWWHEVTRDPELKARWLERFEDPAESFARACERIKHQLDRIPIRSVAA